MILTNNIKYCREELEMTQEELAVKAGYKDRSAVAKIESGTVGISLSTFLARAKILKTTPQALIGTSYTGDFPDAFSCLIQIHPALLSVKKPPLCPKKQERFAFHKSAFPFYVQTALGCMALQSKPPK